MMTVDEVKAVVLDMVRRSDVLVLATKGGDPYPHMRSLFNLRNVKQFPKQQAWLADKGLSIFLSTNTSSVKVKELGADAWSSVYLVLPGQISGVCLSGQMHSDPAARVPLWVEGSEQYYPKGIDDPDYMILRLDPVRARGWHAAQPFDVTL
jgi:general stress protein 26